MSALVLTLLYAVGLGAGWLIGAIGVGGVLLVPALVVIGGMDVSAATPVASLSFLFTGVFGTGVYARTGRLKTDAVLWLTIGAAPGAIAGAATNVALPSRAVTIAIVIVLAAATVRTLRRPQGGGEEPDRDMSRGLYVTIGGLVGFASALTGTGGPVLLIPVIMLVGGATVTAVAAGQPIQIPIALAATAGFLILGEIDWPLGIGLGLAQGTGTVAGAHFSHRAPARMLQNLVSIAMGAAAIVFVTKAVLG